MKPLAYKLRPTSFDNVIGQDHLVGKQGILRKFCDSKSIPSLILFGKAGIGKTTIASIMASTYDGNVSHFNASVDTKATLKKIVDNKTDESILVIIDEIHRMNKNIQDYLLPFIENGKITIIGITTVNPYHSVNPAIRSRCLIYKLNELSNDDLEKILISTLKNITIEKDAINYLVLSSRGEVRTLLNFIEALLILNLSKITLKDCEQTILNGVKQSHDFYDILSGLQKSIRGSDVNASLHYLALLLSSNDLISITRRLQVIAYEDIGLANPAIAPRVVAACKAAMNLGMPEARIPLGVIVCDMALSPKSNSGYMAINQAVDDVSQGLGGILPSHLKNLYSFDGNKQKYKYPFDYPNNWVNQEYMPKDIAGKEYFIPKDNSKYETALKEKYEFIKNLKNKSH